MKIIWIFNKKNKINADSKLKNRNIVVRNNISIRRGSEYVEGCRTSELLVFVLKRI